MELTVAKTDLQKELQLCQGVVEKRSTIPILSNVLLKAADGRLQIAATDLDVTILSSCAARVTTPGGVTIEARRLFDVIRSLPDEDVHIAMQERSRCEVLLPCTEAPSERGGGLQTLHPGAKKGSNLLGTETTAYNW